MTRRAASIASGALVLVWLLPVVPLMLWSVAHGWRFPDILPPDMRLAAWSFALSDASGVLGSLGVTALVGLMATAGALVLGLPAARALALHRFRGRGLVMGLILAPVIVPSIAVALGLHGIFLSLGLTNSLAGVALVHLVPTLPYMVLILMGVFDRHDTAFEDQARSLGARPWQTFRHVTVPAILPGIIVACLFTFLVSWSQFILTLMIGGGRVMTLPLLLFGFATAGRHDLTAAISLIYILPGLLIIAATSRHLSGRSAAFSSGVRG